MTEGLSGFGEFREAISNLERAAGGGSMSEFEQNSLEHPPGPGYVQAEDGSWVPPSYWDAPSPDDTFAFNSYYDENAYAPGYTQAEDGSWVPPGYYD